MRVQCIGTVMAQPLKCETMVRPSCADDAIIWHFENCVAAAAGAPMPTSRFGARSLGVSQPARCSLVFSMAAAAEVMARLCLVCLFLPSTAPSSMPSVTAARLMRAPSLRPLSSASSCTATDDMCAEGRAAQRPSSRQQGRPLHQKLKVWRQKKKKGMDVSQLLGRQLQLAARGELGTRLKWSAQKFHGCTEATLGGHSSGGVACQLACGPPGAGSS